MENIIQYGIGMDYVPSWGFKEAYREILQNFLDFGHYYETVKDSKVSIENDFHPNNCEFLKIGFTEKHNSDARGGHGEGLKIACLVLLRSGINCEINFGTTRLVPTVYKDDYLGDDCFGFLVEEKSNSINGFQVIFDAVEEYKEMKNVVCLSEEDYVFRTGLGSIINKEAGEIYVGGLYTTTVDRLDKAFDLSPEKVKLGRDRSLPSTFDIEYYTSKITQEYIDQNEDIELNNLDFNNRDFVYCDSLPDRIIDEVTTVLDGDNYIFKNKKTGKIIHNSNITNILFKSDSIKEQINKIIETLNIKESPTESLTKFRDKYYHLFNGDDIAMLEFEHLITLSMKWVVE